MSNWDIYIGIAIAIVVIVIVCYLLSKVCKVLFAILAILFKPVIWFFGLFCKSNKKSKSKSVASATTPKYKSLAEFAATVAADPKAIDSNLHAIFTDLRNDIAAVYHDSDDARERAILAVPLASLDKIAKAKIKDKSKPMFTSVGALAFAIEDKDVRLDAAIRRILTEIYDYCELCTDNDDVASIAYDLEQTLWPHDISEAQAEASCTLPLAPKLFTD